MGVITNVYEEGHVALLKELPSDYTLENDCIPRIHCASPLCPTFNTYIEAGCVAVTIEPPANLTLPYVPSKPRAGLIEVHESPLDNRENLRGKVEHDALWFHLTCLEAHCTSTNYHAPLGRGIFETPTLNLPLATESHLIRLDPRPFFGSTEIVHIDSASLQALYKWQGVIQLEKALSFQDGNQGFFINDDMDAVYLVEEHSKVEGRIGGTRVEITGAQARGQLLSTVLRRIGYLKTMALREKANSELMRGSVEFAMSVDRRVEQIEESSRQETERSPAHERRKTGETETGPSDYRHVEGLEMIDWTLSRPYSSTAADNDNLDDGLINRYDTSKWGSLSPEDANMIFWNRVPWHLGLPNGQVWVRFPARVVRMTNPIQDKETTSESMTTSEEENWPMNESQFRAPSSPSDDELPLWEKSLLRMGRYRLTQPESEIDRDEGLLSVDSPLIDMPSETDSMQSEEEEEDDDILGANGISLEAEDSMSEVESLSSEVDGDMDEAHGASSDSESISSEAS